jgi:glycosyltransferase involved in cell wall biosynthesis
MEKNVVSVVMPAFNAGKYIRSAVHSILNQTYKNLELIIIDDASEDDTYSIAQSFLVDTRVILLSNDQNEGIVFSRNKGIALAKGEYIAMMDSDDVSLPTRIEHQVRHMKANPDWGAIGSYYHVIDGEGKKVTTIKLPKDPYDISTFLLFNVSFCHSTLMMRTDVAKAYRYRSGFDIIEDYEIAYRISRDFPIGNLPEFAVLYRVHGLNISLEKKERLLYLRKQVDEIVLKDLGICFSNEDLELHTNFLNLNDSFFDSKSRVNDLENWIVRFYSYCTQKEYLNMNMIKRIITVRWSIICYRNRFYFRLIHNRLWREFRGDFMMYNIQHVQNMVKGTLEVV